MKTFRIYKPACGNLDFFEMEHRSRYNLALVGKKVPFLSQGNGVLGTISRVLAPLNVFRK